MMKQNFLIIDAEVLPDYFAKVVEAKRLVETKKVHSVSAAVLQTGISRSTYYKYKDFVFAPGKIASLGKKAVFSFDLAHKAGALSEVLSRIRAENANILTINQNLPIGGKAHITLSIETKNLKIEPMQIKSAIASAPGVSGVSLVAIE